MNSYYFFAKILSWLGWFILLPAVISFVSLPLLFEATNFIQQRIVLLNNNTEAIDQLPDSAATLVNVKIPDQANLSSSSEDYRAFVLDTYFAKYNSPLAGSGISFVNACNKYGAPADCTTLAGIGFVETRLCTLAISATPRNCWGFGGSGSNRLSFNSFDEAIDLITSRLVNSYGNSYITNPVLMQATYCGPQCISWGAGVNQARNEINQIAINLNLPPMLKP